MSFSLPPSSLNMIKGIHAMFETPNAEELRAFIRDKLGFPYTDTGDGWLIFSMKEADIGCHPAEKNSHSISFYCTDIQKTVQELKSRGVQLPGYRTAYSILASPYYGSCLEGTFHLRLRHISEQTCRRSREWRSHHYGS